MANTVNRAVALFLCFLMIFLPLTQIELSSDVESNQSHESITSSTITNSVYSGQSQFTATFVDDASYFDNRRPVDLSIGLHHSCVVFDDGSLECSGYDN